MFDNLTDKLQETFRKLRGQARLTEANIAEAMREIRIALLEADVNLKVAREFIEEVRQDCLGEAVLKSVTPGQQVVKIVNDRLTALMGESEAPLDLQSSPTVIMLVGLHGSGKTTTSAKLAKLITKQNKRVLLTAADIYRPAAIDQLEVLGRELNIPVYTDRATPNVPKIAADALAKARHDGINVVIIDTAGRFQVDQQMVAELVQVRQITGAQEVILVADAALGQEAVSVAEHFHQALDLSGIILTKLDGDARGGAALSIRKVTGCPIKFVGTGEKIDDLEPFYPDRMASRILGMGDVVSLVEKAAEEIDIEEAEKLREKLRKSEFDFNDFLNQLRQLSKLGGMETILKMLPGGRQLSGLMKSMDPNEFKRMEAMILSMTPAERENADIIDFSRRKRIAAGSGNKLDKVSQLINQFTMMRKMMKKTGLFSKLLGGSGGGMPDLSGALGGGGMGGGMGGMMSGLGGGSRGGSNFTPSKKKKRKKKKRR